MMEYMDPGEECPEEVSKVLTIRTDGRGSMKILVTSMAKELGATYNDQVWVTLRKVEKPSDRKKSDP